MYIVFDVFQQMLVDISRQFCVYDVASLPDDYRRQKEQTSEEERIRERVKKQRKRWKKTEQCCTHYIQVSRPR